MAPPRLLRLIIDIATGVMVTSLAQPSLDSLYRAHGRWLTDWLAVRARCHANASDLAQETFCRIAEQSVLRLHSHPRRYLATVARRLLIDDVRRKASERAFLDAYTLLMGSAEQPGPDRVAEAVQELCAVGELLGQLPVRVRSAFLMSRLDGLTYAQIAAELGVSASMVKQYIARAFLHCYVAAYGDPD